MSNTVNPHPNQMSVAETLHNIMGTKDREERILMMQNHPRVHQLRSLFSFCFANDLVKRLPDGPTPFTSAKKTEGDLSMTLWNEIRRLYIFSHPEYKQLLIETHWVGMLEMIDADDAEILDLAKDGKPNKAVKGLTEKFVRDCFPDLLPE